MALAAAPSAVIRHGALDGPAVLGPGNFNGASGQLCFAARHGEHIVERMRREQLEASWSLHLSEHGDVASRILHDIQVEPRLQQDACRDQPLPDAVLGGRQRETRQVNGTGKRNGDVPVVVDTQLARNFRHVVHLQIEQKTRRENQFREVFRHNRGCAHGSVAGRSARLIRIRDFHG